MNRELRDAYYSVIHPNNYIQISDSNLNVIITAPHGGGFKPFDIPKRKSGVLVQDTYTRRLAHKIISLFCEKPKYLIADIHRSKIDLNRNRFFCCDNNPQTLPIWKSWNNTLAWFKNDIVCTSKKGLLIDIHSHNDGNYFELGYNLSASAYRRLFEEKCSGGFSTLDSLGYPQYDMIFGEFSFKRFLECCGYSILFPKGGEAYFNGGYNIEKFSGDGLGAIQIEVPVSELKKDLDHIALCLYNAISIFKERFVDDK